MRSSRPARESVVIERTEDTAGCTRLVPTRPGDDEPSASRSRGSWLTNVNHALGPEAASSARPTLDSKRNAVEAIGYCLY